MAQNALSLAEYGRRGGQARARKMSPQQRKASSRKAYLSGALNSLIRHYDKLDQDQRDRLTDFVIERMTA
jgi:hypothetical protein